MDGPSPDSSVKERMVKKIYSVIINLFHPVTVYLSFFSSISAVPSTVSATAGVAAPPKGEGAAAKGLFKAPTGFFPKMCN